MSVDVRGHAVVITGAAGGLGSDFAREFARRGARVLVNGPLHEEDDKVARLAEEITSTGGIAVANYDDVAYEAGGAALVLSALDVFGRVDAVIHSAGCLRDRTLAKLSGEELREVLDVHLRGAFHVVLPAYREMKEQGSGCFVFLTSAAGLFGNPGQANYAAAKMGLVGLSSVVAIEGERHGIRSNVVSPYARTATTANFLDAFGLDLQPEQITPLVVYLASSGCDVTHRIFSAGGGHFARVFVGRGQGWTAGGDRKPTAEDVAANMEAILDASDVMLPDSAAAEIALLAEKLRG